MRVNMEFVELLKAANLSLHLMENCFHAPYGKATTEKLRRAIEAAKKVLPENSHLEKMP